MQLKFIFLCLALAGTLIFSAQPNSYESRALAESYTSLPAGIVKKELSEFVLKAHQITGKRDAAKSTLQRIPLVDYTDSSATFFRNDVMLKITRTGFSPPGYSATGRHFERGSLFCQETSLSGNWERFSAHAHSVHRTEFERFTGYDS